MNCRDIVTRNKHNPILDGHLSIEYGFMSPITPEARLPGKFAIWNELVDQVPELYFSNKTQSILEEMPVLDAIDLEDIYLSRAATILSFLAHAYWRHGVERAFNVRISNISSKLPDCIAKPWQQINQRLGRGDAPYQSFFDLFINNFRIRNIEPGNAYNISEIKVENLDVLIPVFNNDAERVFFMSFVEMHAVASPLIGMICEIERKMQENTDDLDASLIVFFDEVGNILRSCLKTLLKINPIPGSKTYCDPILWAKTIAIFSVAPTGAVQGGTSGAFAPLTLILDALLNRKNYESDYGRYIQKKRELLLPKPILDFVIATSNLKLADYITKQQTKNPEIHERLKNSYNQLIEVYAGPEGFLGRHTSKVFNYLGVSTMVGRNQSTSGDERFVHQNTWVDVCTNLKISRMERKDQALAQNENVASFPKPEVNTENLREIDRLELALHHTREDCWVVIDGYVYDITSFIDKHPGGDTIMTAYAGRDVTEHFNLIFAHQKPVLKKLMEKMLVGKYICPKCLDQKYVPWMNFVNKLLFIRSITAAQFHHMVNKKLEILFAGHTHTHFIQEHLPEIVKALPFNTEIGTLEGKAWETLRLTRFVTTQDLRGEFSESQLVHFAYVAQLMETESLSLIDDLIEFILERINTQGEMENQTAKTCLSIILRWLKSHLKTITVIERQEVSLFGHSLMEHVTENKSELNSEPEKPNINRVINE